MASLSIPDLVAQGLAKIASLKRDQFLTLVDALEGIPVKICQPRVFDDVEFDIKGLSEGEVNLIKNSLFGIYRGRTGSNVSVTTYVNDIIQSLKEETDNNTEWIRSKEAESRLKERLPRLLSINSLELVAKAHDVLLEHEQIFSSARIVTDIRPIFGEKAEDPPQAAVLVHMLNISFSRAGRRDKFTVALDTKDIDILLDALNRAKAKATSLESAISPTGMTYIEVI